MVIDPCNFSLYKEEEACQQFKASLSHLGSVSENNKQLKSNYLKESSTVSMTNTNIPLVCPVTNTPEPQLSHAGVT